MQSTTQSYIAALDYWRDTEVLHCKDILDVDWGLLYVLLNEMCKLCRCMFVAYIKTMATYTNARHHLRSRNAVR